MPSNPPVPRANGRSEAPEEEGDSTRITSLSNLETALRARRQEVHAYLVVLAGSNLGEMYKIAAERTILGRGRQCNVALLDDGVSRAHAEITARGEEITLRDLGSRNGTFCNGTRVTEQRLNDGDKIHLGQTTILKFTFSDDLDERYQRHMHDSALRDTLTTAYNKRYFNGQLEIEFGFSRRQDTALALLLIDLDDLKSINDRHGHAAGDRALENLARIVGAVIRSEDVLARIGGDEFAVLCRATHLENAVHLAERLRGAVAAQPIRVDEVDLVTTVSVGVAARTESQAQAAEELLAAADRALYRAKNGGRNRVETERGEG